MGGKANRNPKTKRREGASYSAFCAEVFYIEPANPPVNAKCVTSPL